MRKKKNQVGTDAFVRPARAKRGRRREEYLTKLQIKSAALLRSTFREHRLGEIYLHYLSLSVERSGFPHSSGWRPRPSPPGKSVMAILRQSESPVQN